MMRSNSHNFQFLKKKKVLLAIIIFAVVLIAPADIAYAGYLVDWALEALIYAVAILPLSWILAGAGTLANYMMQPIQITTSNTVQMGWGITRDFANMFFILMLLGIALDYVLMGASFGMKRALPTFIAVALLINFSLPIAGVVIDASNIFTSFFLKEMSNGDVSGHFANLVKITDIFDAPTVANAANQAQISGATITDSIFAVFFLIGNIFILLALSLMFLIRTGYLMGLLVVLPLVLVVMPFNKSYWGKWSGKFMQYVMFAPAATFFLYMSMKIFEGNVLVNMNAATAQGEQGMLDQIVQYIVIWFFMGGSLVAANSFGVHGSGAALKMFNQGENWVKGKIKGGAIKAGKVGAGEVGRRIGASEKMDKTAEWLSQHGGFVGSLTARGIRGVATKTEQSIKRQGELTKEKRAEYETYSDSRLIGEMKDLEKSPLPFAQAKAAQIAEILAKRGSLNMKNENGQVDPIQSKELVKRLYGYAKKYNLKDAAKNIGRANLVARAEIIQDEYEKGGNDYKEIEIDGKKTIINTKTGLVRDQALSKAFDISTADMDGMKGTWTDETVKMFMKYGLNTRHIRKASDIKDSSFLDPFEKIIKEKEIEDLITKEKENVYDYLGKHNRALLHALKAGNISEFIGAAEAYEEKKKDGNQQGEKPKRQAGFTSPDL